MDFVKQKTRNKVYHKSKVIISKKTQIKMLSVIIVLLMVILVGFIIFLFVRVFS